MENTQLMRTGKEYGSKAAISDASTKSKLVAATEQGASVNSSPATTATMQSVSSKTWTSAELEVLKSKAGLVAGALADFQSAGGLVVVKEVKYKNNGVDITATKLYLVVDGMNLVAVDTPDGLDFNLVAVENVI